MGLASSNCTVCAPPALPRAGDDAEVGARLCERVRIGRRVEVADGVFPWVSCIIAELVKVT
jgi:hypothetical protein